MSRLKARLWPSGRREVRYPLECSWSTHTDIDMRHALTHSQVSTPPGQCNSKLFGTLRRSLSQLSSRPPCSRRPMSIPHHLKAIDSATLLKELTTSLYDFEYQRNFNRKFAHDHLRWSVIIKNILDKIQISIKIKTRSNDF